MPDVKRGDRVKVTITGTVSELHSDGMYVTTNSDTNSIHNMSDDSYQVEVIEPEYTVGAVYKDADNDILIRTRDGWYQVSLERNRRNDWATRPLKIVTPNV